MTVPSADAAPAIGNRISAVSHRAETPADYATSTFVRDRLFADGFDVSVVPFQVLSTNPIVQRLERVSPTPEAFDLREGDPAHHTPEETTAGHAFMELSGDGDVTTPLYHLDRGTPGDWAAFDDLGVTMPKGAIVIERLGNGGSRDPLLGAVSRTELEEHGVAGLIVDEDPRDDGADGGVAWPAGNRKDANMAERT